MTTSGSKARQFILQSMIPILCSIFIGFVFFQGDVFNRHYSAFQFVWSGAVASLFYYMLVLARQRDAFYGFALLLILTFLITGSDQPTYIIRDILYAGDIGLTVFLYFKYFRQRSPFNCAYPAFMLAGIYGVVYIITAQINLGILRILSLHDTGENAVSLASTVAFFGVLIGFAVGFGIGLSERFFSASRNK